MPREMNERKKNFDLLKWMRWKIEYLWRKSFNSVFRKRANPFLSPKNSAHVSLSRASSNRNEKFGIKWISRRAKKKNARENAIDTLWTIWSSPVTIADASTRFQIIGAAFRATGQTLIDLLINRAAVFPLPSGFACKWNYDWWASGAHNQFSTSILTICKLTIALPIDACTVRRASGIHTIACKNNNWNLNSTFWLNVCECMRWWVN